MCVPLLLGMACVISGLENLGSLGPFGSQFWKTRASEEEEGQVFPAKLGDTQHFSEALDNGPRFFRVSLGTSCGTVWMDQCVGGAKGFLLQMRKFGSESLAVFPWSERSRTLALLPWCPAWPVMVASSPEGGCSLAFSPCQLGLLTRQMAQTSSDALHILVLQWT